MRHKMRLGWCILYRDNTKLIEHLFVHCTFSKQVWTSCRGVLGDACIQEGVSFMNIRKAWVDERSTSYVLALPLLLCWGIWLANNKAVLPDILSYLVQVVVNSKSILAQYPQSRPIAHGRNFMVETPDVNSLWGYFDGASQAEGAFCGGRFVLYLTKQHSFHVILVLGRGSNNWAELLTCKSLSFGKGL